jgi:hypothetical protein
MLRILLLALLAANLLFFGFTRGWFDGLAGLQSHGDREPERIANQVHPASIVLMPPRRRPAPAAAALESAPVAGAEAGAAEAALRRRRRRAPERSAERIDGGDGDRRHPRLSRRQRRRGDRRAPRQPAAGQLGARLQRLRPARAGPLIARAAGRRSNRATAASASTALSSSISQPAPSAPPPPLTRRRRGCRGHRDDGGRGRDEPSCRSCQLIVIGPPRMSHDGGGWRPIEVEPSTIPQAR